MKGNSSLLCIQMKDFSPDNSDLFSKKIFHPDSYWDLSLQHDR
ncbi:MAG: hypothetical protein ABI683_13940 [Ginsengibacter sp.]